MVVDLTSLSNNKDLSNVGVNFRRPAKGSETESKYFKRHNYGIHQLQHDFGIGDDQLALGRGLTHVDEVLKLLENQLRFNRN